MDLLLQDSEIIVFSADVLSIRGRYWMILTPRPSLKGNTNDSDAQRHVYIHSLFKNCIRLRSFLTKLYSQMSSIELTYGLMSWNSMSPSYQRSTTTDLVSFMLLAGWSVGTQNITEVEFTTLFVLSWLVGNWPPEVRKMTIRGWWCSNPRPIACVILFIG